MSDTDTINKVYFNKLAADFERTFAANFAVLEEELKKDAEFIGVKPGTRFLDYACGTGFLSWSLSDHVSRCVGIDVSDQMVKAYNTKAVDQGYAPDIRAAFEGNLLLPSDPSPAAFSDAKFFNFDLIGVGTAFHHFDDPDLGARRLAERLRPGGVLFVLDFLPHEVNPEHAARGLRHHGFSEERVRRMFEGAGLGGDFGFKVMEGEIVIEPHGHAHAHGHSHDHAQGEGDNSSHDHIHDHHGTMSLEPMRRKVFIARGTKL